MFGRENFYNGILPFFNQNKNTEKYWQSWQFGRNDGNELCVSVLGIESFGNTLAELGKSATIDNGGEMH